MAADFPDNPNVNDTFTVGDRTWIWNGTTWDAAVEEVLSADAPITFNSSTRTVGLDQAGVQDGRNYIINGAFDIWQRGGSFTGLTTKEFTADRWFNFASGNTANITKESFTPAELEANGFGDAKYYLKLDVTTGDDFAGVGTRIEDARTLAGQDIVFSFWAKGTNPSDNQLRVRMRQDFNGSQNVRDIDTITLTASWTRYELTATVPSVSGQTINASSYLEISFNQIADTTDAWELNLWGVQLEAGSVATPFKRNANSIQGELAACQRYYFRNSQAQGHYALGMAISTTASRYLFNLPVPMRVPPTSIEYGAGVDVGDLATYNLSPTSLVINGTSPTTVRLDATVASGQTAFRPQALFGASATSADFIAFSAEL